MALVFNIERVGEGGLRGQRRHDQRIDNPKNCDPERRHLNRVLVGSGDPVEDVAKVVASHKAKARSDNEEPYMRFVLSASPDELDTPEKIDAFEKMSINWLRKHYGSGLAYAVAHLDEQTYHIHAVGVPLYQQELTRNGKTKTTWKISKKQHPATAGKDSYARLRKDCAEELGLDYGEAGGKPRSEAERNAEILEKEASDTKEKAMKEAKTITSTAEATAAKLIEDAEKKAARAERKMQEAKDFARACTVSAEAIIDDKLAYRPAAPGRKESLKRGPNFPKTDEEIATLGKLIRPAWNWAIKFARKVAGIRSDAEQNQRDKKANADARAQIDQDRKTITDEKKRLRELSIKLAARENRVKGDEDATPPRSLSARRTRGRERSL